MLNNHLVAKSLSGLSMLNNGLQYKGANSGVNDILVDPSLSQTLHLVLALVPSLSDLQQPRNDSRLLSTSEKRIQFEM